MFGEQESPVIEFSHDVDYIDKTLQLRIKQTAFHFFNSLKFISRLNLKRALNKFIKGVGFASRKSDYWCFDYWIELERKLKIESTYYLYAKVSDQKMFSAKQWLIDPSYDVARNKRLKNKCRELLSIGHQIGLHGSFYSAEDEDLFLKEKEVLAEAVQAPVTKSRQHWLNYSEYKTPYIHDKSGIEIDSTMGFNDMQGFRAGIASKYNPFDHRNSRPFSFEEIPLVIVDSHLYDYSGEFDLNHLNWFFDCMSKVKKFNISVGWHQRSISSDYGWEGPYKNIAENYKNHQRFGLKQLFDSGKI